MAFNQLMSGKYQDVLVGPFIDYLNDFFFNPSNSIKADFLFTHDARLSPLKNYFNLSDYTNRPSFTS